MNKLYCLLLITPLLAGCGATGRSLGVAVGAKVGSAQVDNNGNNHPAMLSYSAKGYKVVVMDRRSGPPMPISGVDVMAFDPAEATTEKRTTLDDGSAYFQMRGVPTFWAQDKATGEFTVVSATPQASDTVPNQFLVVHFIEDSNE